MAVNSGNSIQAADFNNLQSRILQILGNGTNDFGYGQGVSSSQVTALSDSSIPNGDSVTETQINQLLADFDTVYTHQTGSSIFINEFVSGEIIGADQSAADITFDSLGNRSFVNPDTNKGINDFFSVVSTLENNRFQIANNQIFSQININDLRQRDWSDTVDSELTVSFGSANDRRYFFNAGGSITLEGTVDLGTSTGDSLPRDSGWKDIIENVSEINFQGNQTAETGNASGVSFPQGTIGNYQLTSSYQTVLRKDASSGLYSNSFWEVQARENSSSEIQFRIELVNRGPESNTDAGNLGSEPNGVRELVTADINFAYGFKKADGAVVVAQPTLASVNTFDPNPNELFIATPSNQSPSNNAVVPTNLGVTLNSSGFNPINGTDTHESSQWILRKISDDSVVFNDETTSQLTSYFIDASVFDDIRGTATDYEWQVRYKGQNTQYTPWSSATGFTASQYAEFNITLDSNVRSYSLFDSVTNNFNWNQTQPLQGTLTIASGVVVGSTNPSNNALEIVGIPSSSIITLQNNGRITGAGGDGADATSTTPAAGVSGGTALRVTNNITIQNANGVIAGGGGGGGAGHGRETYTVYANNEDPDGTQVTKDGYASGGGGAGDVVGDGGDATTGTNIISAFGSGGTLTSGGSGSTASSGAGTFATGGAGGSLGQSGSNGSDSSGGSAGNAIVGISNITFASGSGNVVGPTS